MTVTGSFTPRGGITSRITARFVAHAEPNRTAPATAPGEPPLRID